MRKRTTAAIATGTLVLGIAIGGATTVPEEEQNNKQAKPEVITETVTEVKEVEVSVTPDACLRAVEALEFMTDWSSRYIDINAKAWNAASRFDTEELNYYSTQVSRLTSELGSRTGDFDGVIPGCKGA